MLGLDLVSGWLVVMHTYLCYFRLSLSQCRAEKGRPTWTIVDSAAAATDGKLR